MIIEVGKGVERKSEVNFSCFVTPLNTSQHLSTALNSSQQLLVVIRKENINTEGKSKRKKLGLGSDENTVLDDGN